MLLRHGEKYQCNRYALHTASHYFAKFFNLRRIIIHRHGRMVDWYHGYGATTPQHLGRKLAGSLFTAFSSVRRPQRCSTSSDMRALWQRRTADKIRLKTRPPRNFQGSLTCRKSATWGRRLYFPSEGRRAEDFFARKIQRLRPGLNPRSWVPEASMLPHVVLLCLMSDCDI